MQRFAPFRLRFIPLLALLLVLAPALTAVASHGITYPSPTSLDLAHESVAATPDLLHHAWASGLPPLMRDTAYQVTGLDDTPGGYDYLYVVGTHIVGALEGTEVSNFCVNKDGDEANRVHVWRRAGLTGTFTPVTGKVTPCWGDEASRGTFEYQLGQAVRGGAGTSYMSVVETFSGALADHLYVYLGRSTDHRNFNYRATRSPILSKTYVPLAGKSVVFLPPVLSHLDQDHPFFPAGTRLWGFVPWQYEDGIADAAQYAPIAIKLPADSQASVAVWGVQVWIRSGGTWKAVNSSTGQIGNWLPENWKASPIGVSGAFSDIVWNPALSKFELWGHAPTSTYLLSSCADHKPGQGRYLWKTTFDLTSSGPSFSGSWSVERYGRETNPTNAGGHVLYDAQGKRHLRFASAERVCELYNSQYLAYWTQRAGTEILERIE